MLIVDREKEKVRMIEKAYKDNEEIELGGDNSMSNNVFRNSILKSRSCCELTDYPVFHPHFHRVYSEFGLLPEQFPIF